MKIKDEERERESEENACVIYIEVSGRHEIETMEGGIIMRRRSQVARVNVIRCKSLRKHRHAC